MYGERMKKVVGVKKKTKTREEKKKTLHLN